MDDLVSRLRGIYPVGPKEMGLPDRDFSDFVPPISLEAANRIERLEQEIVHLTAKIEDK